MDEAIGEAQPIPNSLPEAPASATVRVWIDGYGVLLTMRDEQVKEVVKKLEEIVNFAKKKGWKSSWKEEEKPKTKPCPECDGMMEFRSGISKKGKKYALWECQANKEHTEWEN